MKYPAMPDDLICKLCRAVSKPFNICGIGFCYPVVCWNCKEELQRKEP